MEQEPIPCKSCGTIVHGRFCSACGEKVLQAEDLSINHYLGALVNAFTFADSKFWRTLKAVVLRPGELSAAYMDGRRVRYMLPVAFFFLANFLYFLLPLFETFNSSLRTQLEFQPYSERIMPMVQAKLTASGMDMETLRALYDPASTANAKLLLVFMVALFAIPLGVLFVRKRKYLSAYITAAFEMVSFHLWASTILLSAIMFLLALAIQFVGVEAGHLVEDDNLSIIVLLLHFHVTIGIGRRFFHCTIPGAIWRSVVMIAGLAFALTGYRLLLFFTTFVQVS